MILEYVPYVKRVFRVYVRITHLTETSRVFKFLRSFMKHLTAALISGKVHLPEMH